MKRIQQGIAVLAIFSMYALSSAGAAEQCGKQSFVDGRCGRHLAVNGHFLRPIQDTECPAATPLDCGNGSCCPEGYTLNCPQMEPTPCFNPDTLSPEQLATLRDHCEPLLSCH